MNRSMTRREFLHSAAVAAAGTVLLGCQTSPRRLSPNERLNIGIIGTANRAGANMRVVESENIVAVCDVDDHFLGAARAKYPQAKAYNDFRRLIEQEDVDAVVVSTADHTHAVATMAALKSGRHVYCEKPLTHTVWEARQIAKAAAKNKKLATQMGTQIHAGDNYRRVVELVQQHAIGPVREVHVWCEKSVTGSGRPADMPPVPGHLQWDLWLGPAPARPYHPEYHPKTWRHFWDFGGGTLGDMGCHYLDLAFWALDLRRPTTIEAEGAPVHPEITPAWVIARWEFPARRDQPPVRLTWYDGDRRPALVEQGTVPNWRNGVLFVGEKGMLLADYGQRLLLPADRFAGFEPPAPFIPPSIGHHAEWLKACKTGSATTCNFEYGAALTETVLLGLVAYRTGHKLDWDWEALNVCNSPQALNYLRTEYRKGWKL